MDPCLGLVHLRCHSVAHKVFFTGMSSDTKNPTARAQLYVDDPAIVISGTQEFIDDIVATVVLICKTLGFRLAFHKDQRGASVIWIGAQINIERDRVVVSIPGTKLKHFFDLVEETLKVNVIAI